MGKAAVYVLMFATALVFGAVVAAPFVVANAFLVSTTWNWLAVPIFGVKALSAGEAFAMAVVLSAVRGYQADYHEPTTAQAKKTLIAAAAWYPMTIGLAWIARHFV